MMAKPVWTNTNRINHANQFVSRPVQLNTDRPNINFVRTNINTGRTNINSVRTNINTGRTNINSVRPRVNTVNTVRSRQPVPTRTSNSFSPKRPQVNQFNQRRHFSKSHSSVRKPFAKNTAQISHSHAVKGNWGFAFKTSSGSSTEELVGFLRKPDESAGFTEIADFLRGSNLRYALTTNPTIYDSLVKQFWQAATAKTLADGTLELHTTIDTIVYTITEASTRNKLQLADASGITMLPNNEIFKGMGHMGYPTDGSFTFWKSFFTPQWRFLVHHILHCISSKSGGWDQFGSNIATTLICLSTSRVYNFSKLIFDSMIFGNMKRGFRGVPRPLLLAMLSIANPSTGQEAPSVTQPQPSSSVAPPTPPSTQPIPSEATTIPPFSQPAPSTPIAETTNASPSPTPSPAHEPMEHTFEQPLTDQQPPTPSQEATTSQLMAQIADLEKQLKETKQTFRTTILTLVERVKSLEVALKRKTKRVLLSDSEEEETEAQGRKTHDLDPLTVNASVEEQVKDISPTTLEAAAILTKVKKIKSVDKGKRYKRRKSSKESAGTGLDFEEVKSLLKNDLVTTDSIKVSVPYQDRGRREGKAPMTEEEETQASKKIKE
ncbi:hypothetical protein Tco_1308944 [Tanacetum coccineum]